MSGQLSAIRIGQVRKAATDLLRKYRVASPKAIDLETLAWLRGRLRIKVGGLDGGPFESIDTAVAWSVNDSLEGRLGVSCTVMLLTKPRDRPNHAPIDTGTGVRVAENGVADDELNQGETGP